MQRFFLALPAAVLAGAAAAQADGRANVLDPKSKAPPAQYRSAFEGYRPFAEPEGADWRKANDELARQKTSKLEAEKGGHKHQHHHGGDK